MIIIGKTLTTCGLLALTLGLWAIAILAFLSVFDITIGWGLSLIALWPTGVLLDRIGLPLVWIVLILALLAIIFLVCPILSMLFFLRS
jgi:hypothetical protein